MYITVSTKIIQMEVHFATRLKCFLKELEKLINILTALLNF